MRMRRGGGAIDVPVPLAWLAERALAMLQLAQVETGHVLPRPGLQKEVAMQQFAKVETGHVLPPRNAGHGCLLPWPSPSQQTLARDAAHEVLDLLAKDTVVRIGGKTFQLRGPLGEGSFGMVWAAEADDGKEVAVKEIFCRSEAELSRAASEGHILRLLAGESPAGGGGSKDRSGRVACATSRRLPVLAASEVEATDGSFSWRVRMVMTRVPGTPLEQFLEQQRRKWAGLESKRHFAEACHYSGELLVQLAPALEHLSSRVYHRDVTPRNILIDDSGPSGPRFGLVDFGLAVDAAKWRSGECLGDLGGDGRYWPVSAWYVFGHGKSDLEARPDLRDEYRSCLDVHALGITALRCLLELTPSSEQGAADVKDCPGLETVLPKLRLLRSAWQRYWSDARRFWQPVYDAFREGGDFEALKIAYARAGVHRIMSADLCALRTALSEARLACEHAPRASGLAGLPAFFDALLLMIRPGREQPRQQQVRGECTAPEVLRCVSQSTVAPDSAASTPSSTSRVSPAESFVLLTPTPGTRATQVVWRALPQSPAVVAVTAQAPHLTAVA
mmetsp:Transcript_28776/g.67055  ORF Transcript_28776/g.67055 Transcript_28776/m.67055 type:complete len:560 (+) Transcript_28776:2-1681(+)